MGVGLRALLFVEAQGGGVDAIAHSGGVWAIGKDVAEMASAAGAGDLGSDHAVAAVCVLLDVVFGERIVKAGPAAMGVKLGLGRKELESAGGAEINSGSFGVSVLSGEGSLGAFFAKNTVLLRGERTTPLFV